MYLGVNHQRRLHRHHDHLMLKNFDEALPVDPPCTTSPHYQPGSAGSLRRHIAASLMRHHRSTESNKHALHPLSPASYASSLEIVPCNPAATPDSSIELRGKNGESSYGFKTSTELLKVLNRIWSLEEQHASNVSLVKALKHELDFARARIKELLRDRQSNRHEIDELMRQISEDNLARNSKEQDRLDASLQSVRKELEDERKLRKRSETLHRKLARELFEVKVALSSSIKELDKQRKSNELLEELCDEFAKGIREYARQVQVVRPKSDMNWTGKPDRDNLVLHLSESWLDERMQMKDIEEAQGNIVCNSVVDKLGHEIETLLATRQMSPSHEGDKDVFLRRSTKEWHSRRRSLESIPEASSAPQNISFEESVLSDPRHIDKTKVGPSSYEERLEVALNGRRKGQSSPSKQMYNTQNDSRYVNKTKAGPSGYEEQEELAPSVRKKGQTPPSVKQLYSPETTPRKIDPPFMNTGERSPTTEIGMLKKSDVYDSILRKKAYNEEGNELKSKDVDKLISELPLSEGESFPHVYRSKEVSSSNNAVKIRNVSPVRQWLTSMKSPNPRLSESSIEVHKTKDGDNSLKSKLQEPKVKGQRSRLKILKDSSQ